LAFAFALQEPEPLRGQEEPWSVAINVEILVIRILAN
jgi:hypothetical protein